MRDAISSNKAPLAVGNYSQAVRAGNFLFLSGQTCVNPQTGQEERESITAQPTRIMENIKGIVEDAGASMDDIVQYRAFLSDMKHFAEFDAVYGKYFSKPFPARMTVASAGIYNNLDVEMDVVVYCR